MPHPQPLPRRVLKHATREERLFHQALFAKANLNFWQSLVEIGRGYFPQKRDFVALMILGVGLYFSPLLRELCLAFALGYFFSSCLEYLVHLYIAHATSSIKRRLQKLGTIGKDMLRFSLEHSIHHGLIKESYVSSPDTSKLKSRIDSYVIRQGGPALLQLVRNSQYGASSSNTWRTHLFFMPITLLVSILTSLVLKQMGFEQGLAFHTMFLFSGQLWITTSAIYHPILHQSAEYIERHCSTLMKFLLDTRLSRFIARSHRMHHARAGQVNQNLNLGFDFLLGWTPITYDELLEMKNENVPF